MIYTFVLMVYERKHPSFGSLRIISGNIAQKVTCKYLQWLYGEIDLIWLGLKLFFFILVTTQLIQFSKTKFE